MQLEDFRHLEVSYVEVPTSALFIDDSYQRPANYSAVEGMIGAWHPLLVGTLTASKRASDRYALVDGQNRWTAGHALGLPAMPCMVVEGMSVASEALLFAALQEARRNIKPTHRFRAQVRGGLPRAVEISRVLTSRGLMLTSSITATSAPESISAVVALERMWTRGGPELIGGTLDALIAGWPGLRGRFRGEILQGVSQFIEADKPDLGRLAATLADRVGSPDQLMERSTSIRKGTGLGGGSAGYTVGILRDEYARGARRSRKARS